MNSEQATHQPEAGAMAGNVAAQLRRFLELGAAQLDAAVRESDSRVEKLAEAISDMASDARALELEVAALEGPEQRAAQARARIRTLSEALGAHAQSAIIALQFYDKLVQRLTHVREGLAIPSDGAATAANPAGADWQALLEQVRTRYSTVEERVLFDFMTRGLSAEQMLKALTGMRAAAATGEFEAF